MNTQTTDKNKLLSLIDNLIAYRKVFVDYDRYRSINQEKINAIAFANEMVEPCQISTTNKTLKNSRTSFYKEFTRLRHIRKKIAQSNHSDLKCKLHKTVNQLYLSRFYLNKCVFNINSDCRTRALPDNFYLKKSINSTNYLRTIRRINSLLDNET